VLTQVTRGERVYFAAVGLLALWVGVWGFFIPDQVGKALPFLVPPLHARFLGAMYLSGLTFMVGAIRARSWAEARIVPPITAVWTGGLLIVSLLHLDAFDLGQPQDAVWFAAYLAYPLIALGLIFRHRGGDAHQRAHGPEISVGARRYLTGQGVVASALGTALFLVPGTMADRWPWPISGLLAQLYSAPLLAYGVGSLLLSRQRTWPEVRVGLIGILVFAVGVLVGSLLHRDLFSADRPATWLWFGAFVVAVASLARWSVPAVSASRAASTA
jgi:hypothetical protein